MADPFPFVAGNTLLASQLNGIGEAAVSFTPSFSGYTRGNGTSVAYYMRVNKLVYVYVQERLGSTSSVTGSITMTLPITATRSQAIMPTRARIDKTGSTILYGTVSPISAAQVAMLADTSDGTYVSFAVTSATVPMTWANTDIFAFGFVYEAA